MSVSPIRAAFGHWRARPGGIERRLKRFGSLLLRLVAFGVAAVTCASAVLGGSLLLFGPETFQRTVPALALLVVSLGAGFALAIPVWQKLLGEYRFRCFYCEGDTARARRHDLSREDAERRSVRYTFDCERCGRVDGEL